MLHQERLDLDSKKTSRNYLDLNRGFSNPLFFAWNFNVKIMHMKYFFKTLQTFLALIFITACGGGGGGGASFSITANSQSFSTDEDAIYIGNLTASTSSASTVTLVP